MTTYKKQKKKGFAAIVALISLPGLVALGVYSSNGNGEDESVGVEVTVKQSSPPRTAEPEKPAKARRYVQPQWVDGGYGVEILKPGSWTGTENDTRR